MTREEQQLEKRFLDLAETAYQRGIVTYSDFLNLNEQHIFHSIRPRLSYIQAESFGGYEAAERQMAAFVPDAPMFCPKYPIACIKIEPLQKKFAEKLAHRDYLGALLNLGIERSKTGDILVMGLDQSQCSIIAHLFKINMIDILAVCRMKQYIRNVGSLKAITIVQTFFTDRLP